MGCVGHVGAWVAWVRELHGSNFNVGLVGCVGQNIFYENQHFMWVIIFTEFEKWRAIRASVGGMLAWVAC